MNIKNVKRILDAEGIWYSSISENSDVCIEEVTTIPHMCADMPKKLFVLTSGNIKEAEESVEDWGNFTNVLFDCGLSKKYLRKLPAVNLILVGKTDIGRAIGALNEAMRH